MPDTFFRNEKDAEFHDIIQPNLYVRVFPDGMVLYSIRVNISLYFYEDQLLSRINNPVSLHLESIRIWIV